MHEAILAAVETDRPDLIGVLEEFCDAFRRRDIDAVAELLLPRWPKASRAARAPRTA